MDVFEILGSINKISIFFFIVTLGVLGYELYVFQKEKKQKQKPKIPTFNNTKAVQPQHFAASPIISDTKKPIKKHKNLTVILAAVLVAVFGAALFFTLQNTSAPEELPPPVNTRATSDETLTPSPIATESSALFITPTTGVSVSPSPTGILLTQEQITTTPTVAVTSAIGGGPVLTSTPSSNFVATAISPTLIPTEVDPTTAESLPVAGFSFPHMFILFLGAATVFFSVLF